MNGPIVSRCLIIAPPGRRRDLLIGVLAAITGVTCEVRGPEERGELALCGAAKLFLVDEAAGLEALRAVAAPGGRALFLSTDSELRRRSLELGAADAADPEAREELRARVVNLLRLTALEASRGAPNAPEALASEVALLDDEGRVVAVNESWRRGCMARGGPADFWLGASYLEVCARAIGVSAEAAAAITAVVRSLSAGEQEEQRVEYRCLVGATVRDCVVLATRFSSPEGEARTLLVHEDISELKRAEQSIRSREELWRAVGLNSPDLVQLIDTQMRIRFINRVLEGYDYDSVLGSDSLSFLQAEARESFEQAFVKVLESGEPERFEVKYEHLDGSLRYYSNRMGRLELNGDFQVIMFSTDISEQRRAEEERAALENQLRQAQKMEALGKLAGGVAHDFNNMLSVILGQCELLGRERSLDERAQGRVASISDAARQSAGLTRQLLAISRKQVLELSALDLNDLVRESGALIERLIGEDIQLHLDLAEDLGPIEADPSQMHQVIMNLAVNARDAMPQGGELRLQTRELRRAGPGPEQGRYALLKVSDDGAGMSPEVRQRIFEPFFTTKDSGKGTGLGLSTAYGIVKQIGGDIEVESVIGEGTAVLITLPVVATTAAGPPPSSASSPRGSGTILLVEDKTIVREVVREMLERQGYEVVEASSGEEALGLFQTTPGIALVLTDIILTGMNGRELVERLKERRADLKVLYMTGYTDDVISDRGLKKDDARVLEKPFSFQALSDALSEALI